MTKVTGSTDPNIITLLRILRKESKSEHVKIWKDVYNRLLKSRRQRVAVNVGNINKHTQSGDTVLIPGKTLGAGSLTHSVCIAALSFSESAAKKIKDAGGEAISIRELIKRNPKGSGVKIMC